MLHRILPFWSFLVAAAIAFVFIAINASVYRALAMHRFLYPETHFQHPPTVSGALRDPTIGEPFGFWVGISALVLALAILPVAGLHYRALRHLSVDPRRRMQRVTWLAHVALLGQMVASLGVVLLSQFRFPDHTEEHIFGSYLFFIGQAAAVGFSMIVMVLLRRRFGTNQKDWRAAGLSRRMSGVRVFLGSIAILLALAFVGLFAARNFQLDDGTLPVRPYYVLAEPALINLYLCYLLTFAADVCGLRGKV